MQFFSVKTSRILATILPLFIFLTIFSTAMIPLAYSAESNNDPASSDFRLVVCDGPEDCDFNAVIEQVQVIINAMVVFGVMAAVIGMTYAGYLYLTGKESNINKAKDIFPKMFWGFIFMLSAWFIVIQILKWLTGDSGFTALLGK